jgi:hypothetical protein
LLRGVGRLAASVSGVASDAKSQSARCVARRVKLPFVIRTSPVVSSGIGDVGVAV